MSFEVTDLRQPCQKTMSRKCNNKTCTHHIIVLFMLIISYVQYAGAHLMLRVNDTSSYKYPTYAPYGIASPSFNLAGILVMPNYAVDRPCTLKREVPLFLQSNLTSKQSNTTHLVALITETSSKSSKCYTVSQACESAVEYLKWLQEEKHLQGVAVVYALTKHIDGVSGGPSGADYTSYNPSIPDTKYTLPTVLLPLEHSRTILPILTDTTTPVQVHLNYEMGPWNEIVLSPGYYIFIGVFMLINTTFVLRAIGSIFKLAATGKFHPELRTIVFVVGFLSSVCMVIFLPLNSATIVCHSFYEVGSILFTIAFYLILLIWCTIHEVVRTSMKLRYLRAGIVICMCLQTMAYTFKFANHFITPSVTYEYIRTASRYAIVILEFIGALIFLHFGRCTLCINCTFPPSLLLITLCLLGKFFYMQKRSSRVNLASSNALFRVSIQYCLCTLD
ncbi:hypothetical protein BDF22DRAFT_689523 [Syncephalis plumigaleata]|nr:hypothetical protein BDF22DRAFT_689523 [Syncephalis plumigaleata]